MQVQSQVGRENFKRRWQFYYTVCKLLEPIRTIRTILNIKHLFEPDDYLDFQEWLGTKLRGPDKMVKAKASFFLIKQMGDIFTTVHSTYNLGSLKL